MRRLNINMVSAGIFFLCALLNAQEVKSNFYALTSPEEKPISAETVSILDGYYARFNTVFHFSKTGPGFLFPVTLFDSAENYTAYVSGKTGGIVPAADAVFLHYNNARRSEVAALTSVISQPVFIRQMFLQYLTFYQSNYPQWLFAGYTLIFENYHSIQNPWLETAKKIATDPTKKLTLAQIFSAQKNDYASDRFFPQAMLAVQFLAQNANNTYRRLLFEGIASLKAGKTAQESFGDYAEYWIGTEQANDDFSVSVSSLKTVSELLAEGIAAYTQSNTIKAAEYFAQVIVLDPRNFTAFYYEGLLAYKLKNYTEAELRYKKALEAGANAALINWAMAVNAYAAERYSDAAVYAAEAKLLDKAAYGQKTDELVQSIPLGRK